MGALLYMPRFWIVPDMNMDWAVAAMMRKFPFFRGPKRGFSFIEIVLTLALVGLCLVLSLSILFYIRQQSNLEEVRTHAYEIVNGEMELIRAKYFSDLKPETRTVTIWDRGTPDDDSDDLNGELEIILKDKTGAVLTGPPKSNALVQAEITLTWQSTGKEMSETLMTYLAP